MVNNKFNNFPRYLVILRYCMRVGLLFNMVYLVGWVCAYMAKAKMKVATRKPVSPVTAL